MEMEVDPERFGAAEATFMDSEANLYQLILACQKIFSTIRFAGALIFNSIAAAFSLTLFFAWL
jgi:hypothetical protein